MSELDLLISFEDVCGSDCSVMGGAMMFSKVICIVVAALIPEDV